MHAGASRRTLPAAGLVSCRSSAGGGSGAAAAEQVARAAALRRALARRLLDTVSAKTLSVLDMLRAGGHRLALVSNATSDTAQAWPHSRLARRFDVAVFSCEAGIAKPDPVIYRVAAQRLGVDAADCVFVGDGGDGELAGAAAVGMTALRTTEHNDSDPRWNGPVVTALGDLPILLREMELEGRVANAGGPL